MRGVHGLRRAVAAAFALLGGGALVAAAAPPARANVPAVFRTCAAVPWRAPSLAEQRAHLGRNPRWSTADRADPGLALDFPFVIRIRSASISYDQGQLGGLWTLGPRATKRLARCPSPGGPRRNFTVLMKGWLVTRAELTDAGGLDLQAHAAPGSVQALHFPGYGSTRGFVDRTLTLERTDAPGCAISSLEGDLGVYDQLLGAGLSCAEVRQLQRELDRSWDWTAPALGFACASGDAPLGERVTCLDGAGRSLRFDLRDEA